MKLKKIATLKGVCRQIIMASATGKMKGNIYFIDEDENLNDVEEWFLEIPAKELIKAMAKKIWHTNKTKLPPVVTTIVVTKRTEAYYSDK